MTCIAESAKKVEGRCSRQNAAPQQEEQHSQSGKVVAGRRGRGGDCLNSVEYRVRRKKPQLTKEMKEARIAFAQARYPPGFWKRVVASDEKTITLGGEVRGEWVKEGEEPSPRRIHKFEPGVKVWAGSSWEGKTALYFLPKSLKAGSTRPHQREARARHPPSVPLSEEAPCLAPR